MKSKDAKAGIVCVAALIVALIPTLAIADKVHGASPPLPALAIVDHTVPATPHAAANRGRSMVESTEWTWLGHTIHGEAGGNGLGRAVALSSDGRRKAVTATGAKSHRGHVRILDYDDDSKLWNQVGNVIEGDAASDWFGASLCMSKDGNRIIVGAPWSDTDGTDKGYIKVFDFNGTEWVAVGQKLTGEVFWDLFGYSVAMSSDGNAILVGAYQWDREDVTGYAKAFRYEGSRWIQVGSTLTGRAEKDGFGRSVAVSSTASRIVIGTPGNDNGYVRVLDLVNGNWEQKGNDLEGDADGDSFGLSVGMSDDGNQIVVGAPYSAENGEDSGSVYVFTWGNNGWSRIGNPLYGKESEDEFGWSVDMSSNGMHVAVAASGGEYVSTFKRENDDWVAVGQDIREKNNTDFGYSISLSDDGTTIAVGAPDSDVGGRSSGEMRVYEL